MSKKRDTPRCFNTCCHVCRHKEECTHTTYRHRPCPWAPRMGPNCRGTILRSEDRARKCFEEKLDPGIITMKAYQRESRQYAFYPNVGENFTYTALGLAGEVGEVVEKVKKILRDDKSIVTQVKRDEIKMELGDVLWYLANLSSDLGIDLEDVAASNLVKLESRKQRDKLKGSGDNR